MAKIWPFFLRYPGVFVLQVVWDVIIWDSFGPRPVGLNPLGPIGLPCTCLKRPIVRTKVVYLFEPFNLDTKFVPVGVRTSVQFLRLLRDDGPLFKFASFYNQSPSPNPTLAKPSIYIVFYVILQYSLKCNIHVNMGLFRHQVVGYYKN